MAVGHSRPIPGRRNRHRYKKSKRGKAQQAINDDTITAQYRAVKKKTTHNKRVKSGTGIKKMKVPIKLRKAITQVVDNQQFGARLAARFCGAWRTNIAANKCGYLSLPILGGHGEENGVFTVYDIMNAAKDLYGGQAYTRIVDPVTDRLNLLPFSAGLNPATQGGGSGFEFDIRNSYVKYHFKNNTARTYILEIYNCASATNGNQFLSSNVNTGGALVDASNLVLSPQTLYPIQVNTAKANGLLNVSYDVTSVNNVPWEVAGMNKLWPHETTKIVIGPGQSENYFVQGPKNVNFKWSKMFKNNQIMDVQKWTRFPFMRVELERLTFGRSNDFSGVPALNISNYVGNPETQADPLLEVTADVMYDFTMPEQVLGNISAGDAPGRNNKILHKYIFTQEPSGDQTLNYPTTTLAANPAKAIEPDNPDQ